MSKSLESYIGVIGTLAYASQVQVSENPPTKGCAIVTVSDKCSAHLVLSGRILRRLNLAGLFFIKICFSHLGLIDPVKEIEKLTKKRGLLEGSLDKLKKAMKVAGYEQKVPKDVQNANKQKLSETETEIKRLGDAMESLKLL